MGRPTKQNLDYFSIDQGFFTDKKFALLTLRHGLKARMIYLYILNLVYFQKGYYVDWDEDTIAQIAVALSPGEPGVTMETVEEIVKAEVKAGLFDENLFNTKKVLTSRGIQETYYFVSKDRKCSFVDFSIWILPEDKMSLITKNTAIYQAYQEFTKDNPGINSEKPGENPSKSGINSKSGKNKETFKDSENENLKDSEGSEAPENPELSKSGINDSKSEIKPSKSEINPESKVKESKVKESKGKESKEGTAPDGARTPDGVPTAQPIDFAKLIQYWNKHTTGMRKINSIANMRKKHVTARVEEVGKEEFFRVLKKALDSSFLNGNSKKGWKASFDWCMNPNNFVKIQEGNYDDDDRPEPKREKTIEEMMRDGDLRFDENGDIIEDAGDSPPVIDVDFEIVEGDENDSTGIIGDYNPVATELCEF